MEHHEFDNINTWVGNGASLGTIAVAFAGYIPAIAAGVALVWYLIQIFESATVQIWLRERREKRIARLAAKIVYLKAQSDPSRALEVLRHNDD